MVKIYTLFKTKTAQKPYLSGQYILTVAYTGEYPGGGGGWTQEYE